MRHATNADAPGAPPKRNGLRLAAVGLGLLSAFVWLAGPSTPPLASGTLAPALTVTTADGVFSLDGHRGHAVVLTFWATWCPACREEAPELAIADQRLRERGDSLLALSVDSLPFDVVRREASALGMPERVALADEALSARYRVSMLPTTYVIAPSGEVAHVFTGGVSADEILRAVDAASASPSPE